ncbi:MAG: hypothetical protein DMG07_13880 [Acidobacteria bacterium]|nr:MAG: hypothetical protein DMG07_13880 [Acidobacteriota bacterium]
MIAFERLAVLDGKPLNYTLLGATLLLFVSGLVGWPVGALRARRQRPPDAPPRSARLLAWLACGLNVAFVTGHACTTRSLRSRWKRRRPEDFGDEIETPISRPTSVTADTVRTHASQIPCRTAAALTALGARAASDFTC